MSSRRGRGGKEQVLSGACGGGTAGEHSDWRGEPVDADNVCLGHLCDVCIGRICIQGECVRVGCVRTTGVEVVKQTSGKGGLRLCASTTKRTQH